MDTSSWKTHCFGRFLIDLPEGVDMRATYSILGNKVERIAVDKTSFIRQADVRESELREQHHRTQGNMFINREPLGGDAFGIISWHKDYSIELMWIDAYLLSIDTANFYKYSGVIDPDMKERAIEIARRISRSLYGFPPQEVPREPGFCLDRSYVLGNEFMKEGFNVVIRLPEHPGMTISFESSTGAEEDTLLERVGGFFRTEILGRVTGINTLRKRRRQVNGYRGEEFLVAGTQRGYRAYAFKWEFQGKDRSLSEPHLTLELDVSDYDPDGDDPPPPPAFQSDREALQLWDAILNSIRLRPGAV